jgi:1,4-dihydroxy-2-naphthoate polyprenyltransferase
MNQIKLSSYIRFFHPLTLIGGGLFYALGAGIAHYLGHVIDWQAYWLGQAWVILLQLSMILLEGYFYALKTSDHRLRNNENKDVLSQQQALIAALAVLAIMALTTTLLVRGHYLNPAVVTILGIAFVLAFFFVIPPLDLNHSGYGELVTAILLTIFFPAVAFLLQAGDLHRMLAMATFPLTPLFLALALAQGLPSYASDIKMGRWTLMLRLGWQRGMRLHDILILVGFLLLAVAMPLGLPWRIAWPSLLVLPIGIYQIWQMNQIAEGAKARWNLLITTAIATVGLITYLLTFGFWTG